MKSTILIALCFTAVSTFAQLREPVETCDIIEQNLHPEKCGAPAATTYQPTTPFEQIRADVDRTAKDATAPSPYVLYDESNTPTQASPPSSTSNVPSVATASGLGGLLAKWAPTSADRAGISKYMSIVQPQAYTSDQAVGTANTGIAAWFDKELSGNACIQRRAVEFYNAVGKATAGIQSPVSGLSRNVQSESQNRLSPGWLWKLALRSAGDPGLALMLIDLCGHDDHLQGGANDNSFSFRDDSEAARASINYKLNRYNEIRSDLQSQIRKPSVQTKTLLGNIDREVGSIRRSHPVTTISCPVRPNIFFASESLGKGVDIPESLKKDIQAAQNPDGIFDLPSKSYHIYSGAFFACQMIETGMSPRTAKAVAAEGAKIYRGIRLCQTLTDQTIGWSPEGYTSPEDFLLSKDLTAKCADRKFSRQNSGLCSFAGQALYYRRVLRDSAELRRKIAGIVSTADASVLYRTWYFGGLSQTVGAHLACTDTQLLGPKDLLTPETDGAVDNTGLELRALFKPRSWSNARYEAAKRKLATWMVDSKWTIAQHKAGAEFAAKNGCKPRPANETLEQAACRIDASKTAKPARAVR